MEVNWLIYWVALVFVLFATFQDIKKREIANWLNYTLLALGIITKTVISFKEGNWMILLYTIIGFLIFYGIASLFYYTKVFAGGDAKLLMALGVVFPYTDFYDVLVYSIGFILLLLLIGAVYTLIYSLFLVLHNRKKFIKCFSKMFKENIKLILFTWLIILILSFFLWNEYLLMFILLLLIISPVLFIYLKSVEESCLVLFMNPKDLSEGEWIMEDLKVAGKIVKNTSHGLNKKDISLLKRHHKGIWIRQGIPFVPAILASWIIMGFFFWLFQDGARLLVSLLLEFFVSF